MPSIKYHEESNQLFSIIVNSKYATHHPHIDGL